MKVILECTVGSTLHGTAVQDGLEDLDLMGICLEPAAQVYGFNTKDSWVERTKPDGVRSEAGDVDRVVYGLRKWCSLALKGNPSVLLPLFAPQEAVRTITMEGQWLRSAWGYFVSKQCYAPFKGYMHAQYERLMGLRGGKHGNVRPELVAKYGFDTKYAMHILRLGMQGVDLLRNGKIQLPMRQGERALLVDVRNGKYPLERVSEMITHWQRELDAAHVRSTLSPEPNYRAVESWMLDVYQQHWRA